MSDTTLQSRGGVASGDLPDVQSWNETEFLALQPCRSLSARPSLGRPRCSDLAAPGQCPAAPRLEGDPPLKQMIRVYFRSGFDDSGSGSFEAMRRTISAAGIMATAPRTPTGGASRRSPALKRMNSPAIPLRAP